MFEALSDKLRKVFKDLRGQGKLTEAHIEAAMREIRMALLEADVNFKVVKTFVDRVKEKALGQEVMESLSPSQQVVKVVYDEMVEMLGGTSTQLLFTKRTPNVVMIVGLQGSGKTTTTGKLTKLIAEQQKRRPLMLSVDVYRPAARQQLSIISKAIGQPVFEAPDVNDPLELCRGAVRECQLTGYDTLMIDTAGRLHVDEELMVELKQIKQETAPSEILFIADAMTGQDAVRSAQQFHDQIGLTGIVLTKMEGDTRGGAALSIKEVTGQPIKFVGVGERYDAIEPFYPDRIAQRILGMGDVLSLIEKVQSEVDEEKALELQEKLARDKFSLEDFRDQLRQMKRLGSLDKILDMLPANLLGGMRMTPEQTAEMEQKLKLTEAIINSMTPEERRNHDLLNASRRKRIARGSGTAVSDVNQMINEYIEMRKMMRMMTSGGLGGMMGGLGGKLAGGLMGGGLPGFGAGNRRKATKRKKKKKKR
ncbi:MAG TPA: signal recognition particle protein [Blastocatellia bacterium]|jgi:signal recognition particle subunit SRP54|nr:signal recognition particle protein [Blastocatellia bacterium]